jgi:hypothetical protein
MSFADLITQLGADDPPTWPGNQPAAATAPRPAPVPVRPRVTAVAPRPNTVPDVESLVGELRRDVAKQTGLIGVIKTKIRGDEMLRRHVATLGRRIDAVVATEEMKLVLFLAISARTIAVQAVTSAMHEMYITVNEYEVGTPAHEVGTIMIKENEDYLISLADTITQRGITGTLRKVGLDR